MGLIVLIGGVTVLARFLVCWLEWLLGGFLDLCYGFWLLLVGCFMIWRNVGYFVVVYLLEFGFG